MPSFTCRVCGDDFTLPDQFLDRYPGWTPRLCPKHRDAAKSGGTAKGSAVPKRRARSGPLLTPLEVLAKYHDGPSDGVFTDGSAVPNPGPGGWGAVYVAQGKVVDESHGHESETTNNRMELAAIIEGAGLVPSGTPAIVHSDSRLVVQTVTEWAPGWEKRGWKRKTGPVENLDLVKVAYRLYRSRPELSLKWVRGHAGIRWNEYADALANTWRREPL
jgi:ribonuclease HI